MLQMNRQVHCCHMKSLNESEIPNDFRSFLCSMYHRKPLPMKKILLYMNKWLVLGVVKRT